jgi:hypothetical protein
VTEPAINIIFRANEDNPDSVFVEVENDDGESVNIGTTAPADPKTGLWSIRITAKDIEGMGL